MFKIIKENEILIVPINQSLTQKVLLKKLSGGENCFKNIKYYLSWKNGHTSEKCFHRHRYKCTCINVWMHEHYENDIT